MFSATVAANTPKVTVSSEYIKLDRYFFLDKKSMFAQKVEKVVSEPSPPMHTSVNSGSFNSILRPRQNEPMILTMSVPL